MNDKRLNELMHDELDGVTTPEESSKLREILSRNPEAMAQFEGLRTVHGLLNRVPLVDAPPDLKAGVLRSIRTRDQSEPERVGWLETLAAAFGRRPVFRFAYAFAAGAVAGIVGFALLTGNFAALNRSGSSPFSGTMAPFSELEGFRKLDQRRFDFTGGWVEVETGLTKHGVVVRIKARSEQEIGIALEFDPEVMDPVGLTQLPGSSAQAFLAPGRVGLNHSGEMKYEIYLARRGMADAPIRVAINSPDGLLDGVLRTGAAGPGN